MNDQEIRIAIAEACGAKSFPEEEYPHRTMWTFGDVGGGEACYTIYDLPDYPNDLNAMHEAEAWLISKLPRALRYEETLVDVCSKTHPPGTEMGSLWHATARQRAEAFLRTIGKWEE